MFKKYIAFICISLSLSGCDFLDLEEATDITEGRGYTYDFNNVNKIGGLCLFFLATGLWSNGRWRFTRSSNGQCCVHLEQ